MSPGPIRREVSLFYPKEAIGKLGIEEGLGGAPKALASCFYRMANGRAMAAPLLGGNAEIG